MLINDVRSRIDKLTQWDDATFKPVALSRQHIFFDLLPLALDIYGHDSRSLFLYEFVLIGKLVKAAQRGEQTACSIWIKELEEGQSAAISRQMYGTIPSVLLPALALVDLKMNNPDQAIVKLIASVTHLDSAFLAGTEAAGLASLEQRLNLIRASLGHIPDNEAIKVIREFLRVMHKGITNGAGDRIELLQGRDQDGPTVVQFFLDELILKIVSHGDLAIFRALLEDLQLEFSQDTDFDSASSIAAALSSLISGSLVSASDIIDNIDTKTYIPASLVMLLDIYLSPADLEVGDKLRCSVAAHPGLRRLRLSVNRMGHC